MKKLFRFQRFKDVSISKKLYFIVGTMAVLIVTELVVLWFSIHTLSSVRAFVGAEGLWSKAQKDAVYNLQKYSRTHKEEDFHAFEKFMKVPFGDHKTLVELLKKNPDVEIARQGFIEGHINTADIEEMISLVRTFHSIYYIHKAVDIWSQGDSVIATLVPISARIHDEVTGNSPSKNSIDQLMGEVDPVNDHLTVLEDDFSSTLGEGSRWLEGLILKLLFSVALTVELTGLILSIFVSRGIRLGLNEINKAAVKITNGDLSQRAKVLSKDEIGRLALSVNQMTEQMISSNKELEAFIYKASHDLKSPLASSRGLVNLALREEPTEETKQYLELINLSLDKLDNILLALHEVAVIRQGTVVIREIDIETIVNNLLSNFADYENFNKIKFTINNLNFLTLSTDEILLQTILRNVIENAIKYYDPENGYSMVTFEITEESNYDLISIIDNGIGIAKEFHDKVFNSFFRATVRSKGSGLGLYIVYNAMNKLGGKIVLENPVEGKGIIFKLYFPKTK